MSRSINLLKRLWLPGLFVVGVLLLTRIVNAAPPTLRSDVMTRLATSQLSSHDISFTQQASTAYAAGETVTIDFDEDSSGWTVNGASTTTADFDFNDGAERTIFSYTNGSANCTGSVGANDIAVGIDDSTGVVTFLACASYSAGSSGAAVNIEYGTVAGGTNRVTNPSGANEYEITIAGTYGDDSAGIAIEIISNEQISVSATVDESMNFSISDNTIGFGTLNASQTRYATGDTNGTTSETGAHSVVVGSNASAGYILTINGATLTSGTDTIDAIGASNTAPSTGVEQFGLRATATGGSGTVSAPYTAAGFAFDTAAFPDQVASASAGSEDTTYSMRYVGNIRSNTEAGAYTATLTYIATGTF